MMLKLKVLLAKITQKLLEIDTNTSNIATNTAAIATNRNNITALSTQIGNLGLVGWVNVTSTNSQNFTHDGVFRGILVAIGNNANSVTGMYLINNTSSSHLSRAVVSASQLTVTVATEKITVSSAVATACHVWMICLEGTGEWT